MSSGICIEFHSCYCLYVKAIIFHVDVCFMPEMYTVQTDFFPDYNTPAVVFNAHSVTTYSPPARQPLVFSSVISNIGNGYSSSTGKFTAPVNGTFIFTVQLCVRTNHGANFGLVLDGTTVTNFYDYDHDYDTTLSTTVPLFLKQGQKVWVTQTYTCSSCLYEYSYCWNRFSGSLIHK